MRILGLDMSSTCIGFAVLDDERCEHLGHQDLSGDIASRAAQAATFVGRLFTQYLPELTVIESPVARFAKAVIPQSRVSGAVLARLHACEALWAEVSPTEAKLALCEDGAATKYEMVAEAARRLDIPRGDIRVWRGKMYAHALNGNRVLSEDEADALGLALAGLRIRVMKGVA